jgi:FkbM family methyltransferase
MLAEVSDGDIVWDVGANVGFYALQFAERVGKSGRVVAFEPNPECVEAIEIRLSQTGSSNTQIVRAALGETDCKSYFKLGKEAMAVDSQLSSDTVAISEGFIEVDVFSGDSIIARLQAPPPNVVKIDVEGFELECLRGLMQSLKLPTVRAVFVEVHFGVLASRKKPYAPVEIQKLLSDSGLSNQVWLDASHLAARRP